MLRTSFFASLSLLTLSLLPGCGDIGPSKGEAGELSFSLRNEECYLLGCPTDREIVSGSEVQVNVTDFASTAVPEVKLGDAAVAEVAGVERSCPESTCAIEVKIEGRAAGNTRLEVWKLGKFVDATTLRFRAPDRVASVVRVYDGKDWVEAPREGDVFVVQRGQRLSLRSVALAGDTELLAGKGTFRVTFPRPEVLAAARVTDIDASEENLDAKTAGDATVAVTTTSAARTEVRVRVKP